MDYFQNVTAATKTFDQPGAPHTIWESEAGSALAVTRLEQILGTSVDVAVNTMREANPLIIAPNPMTTHTWARFSVSETGNVSLRVYDVAGRQVTDLVDGILGEGPHEVRLARGALPGGVYFLRLVSSDGLSVGKVSVLR
jgi:hypothetical protein